MIGLPISIFITGDRAKAFDWISVTTVGIDLSIDAMTNVLNAISIHCTNIMMLSFRTDMSRCIVQTKIRLHLEEQSYQGLFCLPFCLHLLKQ